MELPSRPVRRGAAAAAGDTLKAIHAARACMNSTVGASGRVELPWAVRVRGTPLPQHTVKTAPRPPLEIPFFGIQAARAVRDVKMRALDSVLLISDLCF